MSLNTHSRVLDPSSWDFLATSDQPRQKARCQPGGPLGLIQLLSLFFLKSFLHKELWECWKIHSDSFWVLWVFPKSVSTSTESSCLTQSMSVHFLGREAAVLAQVQEILFWHDGSRKAGGPSDTWKCLVRGNQKQM